MLQIPWLLIHRLKAGYSPNSVERLFEKSLKGFSIVDLFGAYKDEMELLHTFFPIRGSPNWGLS
jgi:hypothetical protein